MIYCQVWLRNVRDVYTWHTDTDVRPGVRVRVMFRGRPRVGIVIGVSDEQPEFKTQPVVEVWDEAFLPPPYLRIAADVADEQFTTIGSVLKLMIPEKFLLERDPVVREIEYSLAGDAQEVRGKKQVEILQKLANGPASEQRLREIAGAATIKSLLEKKAITRTELGIRPVVGRGDLSRRNHDLTLDQQAAFDQILNDVRPSVLFGVTGSGKTEVYKKLAAATPGQTLLLLPEIALTPQLIAEFQATFGTAVAVWHSKLSAGEKIQEWERCRRGEAKILVGARSAAWVPLADPRLVILDEEHEWTFKSETSPRIWTHDLVGKIAGKFGSKIVFGSATPRVESIEKTRTGDWQLVRLDRRVQETQMPEMRLIDLRSEAKKGNYGPLSETLVEQINEVVSRGKQAILFLNRRGFSGSTTCKMCGEMFECPHCDAPMKVHRARGGATLLCHVCGHMLPLPDTCPHCDADDFEFRGWGTQQVETILAETIPGLRVLRADADSITGKNDFRELLEKFHKKEADVLLGTQMIAKGLDFADVELVGVVLADVGLSLPDFRSEERVFQLLMQVAGRAGRRETRGKIVLQTFRPDDKIFSFVGQHRVEEFLEWQREVRERSGMPPFCSVAKIMFSHADKKVAFDAAKSVHAACKKFSGRVDIAPAFFPRTHGKYHFHVFLRGESEQQLRDFLKKIELGEIARIDVAPASFL